MLVSFLVEYRVELTISHIRTEMTYQHPLRLRFLGCGAPAFFGRGIVEYSHKSNQSVEAKTSKADSFSWDPIPAKQTAALCLAGQI